MTVKELKILLESFDENQEIFIKECNGLFYSFISLEEHEIYNKDYDFYDAINIEVPYNPKKVLIIK